MVIYYEVSYRSITDEQSFYIFINNFFLSRGMLVKKIIVVVLLAILTIGSSLIYSRVYTKSREVSLSPGLSYAYTTKYPSADALVSSYYPTKNYGSSQYLTVSYKKSGFYSYSIWSYIKFNLPSIPAEDIEYAKLHLTLEYQDLSSYGTSYKKIYIYRVLSDWKEDQITWLNKPGGIYTGHYFIVYKTAASGTHYYVDITDLVKAWLNGTYANYGIRLSSDTNNGLIRFYSSEASTSYSNKPYLRIKYKIGLEVIVTPTIVTCPQGGEVSVTVQVKAHGGLSGTVTFSVTAGLPSGCTYSFNPSTVFLSSTSPIKTTTLTVKVGSTTSTGTYNIYVRATRGSYYDVGGFKLTVVQSGFTLSASPSSLTISQGGTATVTITVTAIGTYNKKVTLTLHSAPSGITAQFNPSTLYPGSSSTMTISVGSSVSPGTYNIEVKGVGEDGLTATTSITVTVVSSGFTLSASPSSITIAQGKSKTVTITVNPIGGYSKKVSFTLYSAPSGITAQFNPSSVTPGGSTTMTISVSSSVSPSTYTIVVKGIGEDGKESTVSISVTVVEEPFDFTINAKPKFINAKKGDKVTVTVKVTLVSGKPKPVTLSLYGLPTGTYSFGHTKLTPTASTKLVIDTSGISEGTYTVTVEASGGGVTKTVTITLKVMGFDFTVSVEPSTIEIEQGSSGSVVVKVKLVKGTPEEVVLSLEGLPSGASYSFSPSKVKPTGSSVLTINAGSAKGQYTVIIRATSKSGVTKTATLTIKFKEKKCIIATVTYGSEVADEVQLLRNFRDNIVLSTYAGRRFYVAFNAFYYSWSPYVAQWILANPWSKPVFKAAIYPLIGILLLSTSMAEPLTALSPELAVYLAGTLISYLIGLVYFSPVTVLVSLKKKWFKVSVLKKIGLVPVTCLLLCLISQAAAVDTALTVFTSMYVLSLVALAAYSTPIALRKLFLK